VHHSIKITIRKRKLHVRACVCVLRALRSYERAVPQSNRSCAFDDYVNEG
jgi:hypothetical protein